MREGWRLDLILRYQHSRDGHKLRTFLFQSFLYDSMSGNLGAKSTSESFSMQPKTEESMRKVRRPSKAKSASDAEGERRGDDRGNHSMRQSQDLEQGDAQGSEGTGRLSALNLGRTYGLGFHLLKFSASKLAAHHGLVILQAGFHLVAISFKRTMHGPVTLNLSLRVTRGHSAQE